MLRRIAGRGHLARVAAASFRGSHVCVARSGCTCRSSSLSSSASWRCISRSMDKMVRGARRGGETQHEHVSCSASEGPFRAWPGPASAARHPHRCLHFVCTCDEASRGITTKQLGCRASKERTTGLEPATFGLGKRLGVSVRLGWFRLRRFRAGNQPGSVGSLWVPSVCTLFAPASSSRIVGEVRPYDRHAVR